MGRCIIRPRGGGGVLEGILIGIIDVSEYERYIHGRLHFRAAQRTVLCLLSMLRSFQTTHAQTIGTLSDLLFHLRVVLRLFTALYEDHLDQS